MPYMLHNGADNGEVGITVRKVHYYKYYLRSIILHSFNIYICRKSVFFSLLTFTIETGDDRFRLFPAYLF